MDYTEDTEDMLEKFLLAEDEEERGESELKVRLDCQEGIGDLEGVRDILKEDCRDVDQFLGLLRQLERVLTGIAALGLPAGQGGLEHLERLLGVPELDGMQNQAMADRKKMLAELLRWLEEAPERLADACGLATFAKDAVLFKISLVEQDLKAFRAVRDLQAKTQEADALMTAFVRAERKHKVRICRDLLKVLSVIMQRTEVVREVLERKPSDAKLEVYSEVVNLGDEWSSALAYCRNFKGLVDREGVDAACAKAGEPPWGSADG